MTSRITRARETLARHDRQDPHTSGRVRQAVGGLLVADGLVGLENPLDGRRTRPGILGSVLGIVFSIVFLVVVRLVRDAFESTGSVTSDPAFDDPFFTDQPASPLSSDGGLEIFDWVFTAMLVIGVLLLVVAVLTFLLRLASIVFGVVLLRSGGRMVAAHPDGGAGVDAEVDEVREQLAGLLVGPRRSRAADRRRHHGLLDDDEDDDRF